jgi:hypothetical protein
LSDANAAEIGQARSAFEQAKLSVQPVSALFDILSAARVKHSIGEAVHQDAARWMKRLSKLPQSDIHKQALAVLSAIPPFHFPTAFPEIFLRERSGFDVLLGNPPWEEARLEEVKFWMRHRPGLVSTRQEERQSEINKLRRARPDLVAEFEKEKQAADLLRRVLTSGQYLGMGTGNPDVYKAFYWRFWNLLAPEAWAGIVLPRSAMNASGSSEFRRQAFAGGQFSDLTWLLNCQGWVFDDVEPRYTIVLAGFTKRPAVPEQTIPLRGPFRSLTTFNTGTTREPMRLALSDVRTWTDTWSLPILPTEDAGEVFTQLRRFPRLDTRTTGAWRARPTTELHASQDKHLMEFNPQSKHGKWPILKGESFDIWEPDFGEVYGWASPVELTRELDESRRVAGRQSRSAFSEMAANWLNDPATLPCLYARIAFRDVSRATDTRTIRATLIPPRTFLCHLAPYFLWPVGNEQDQAYLLGVLSSIPLDWYARRFVENHLTYATLNPFPVPRPPRTSALWQRTVELAGRLACPDKRFAKWANAVGVKYGKLHPDEKTDHIHELDAVIAHLYGLNSRQLQVIYETFHEGWDFEDRYRETLKHFEAWKSRI